MPFSYTKSIGANGERTAVLVCGSEHRRQAIAAVAAICNCRILSFDMDQEDKVTPPSADLLLLDIPSITERLDLILSKVAGYLSLYRSDALVWTDLHFLDMAYDVLPPENCHFLIDSSDFDAIPYLTGAIMRDTAEQLHDNSRDDEFGSLHKISDELANFAQTLARMAAQDDRISPSVSDKPVSFRAASADIFTAFAPNSPAKIAPITANAIRAIIKTRRMRDSFFAAELFADPAWDILLDLYAARLENASVSVSSLCIAASVPPTTALRWITAMTDTALLVRRQDQKDARRVFIELSDETIQKLDMFFTSNKERGGMII